MKASRVMGVPQAGQGAADSFLKNESKRIGHRRMGRALSRIEAATASEAKRRKADAL
jgi:hypothetical protein